MRQLAPGLTALAVALALWLGWTGEARAQAGGGGVRQVFLIQNSGWMEPFFEDPRSRFRLLATSLAAQSNLQGVPVTVATFNQNGQTATPSPHAVFEGAYNKAALERAVQQIELPRKASGAYADADFHGALQATIARLLGGREGVIWMLTNNKDSPNNSQSVVQNTHRFYSLLRNSPYITRIEAFPIRDEVHGPNFHEKGLIVYAIAYGERAGRALDVILRDGSPTRALFSSPPVRIKPLNRDPVELRLAKAQAGGVETRVGPGGLELTHVRGGRPIRLDLTGALRNTYYPQAIQSAQLEATWSSKDPVLTGGRATIMPQTIANVPALGQLGPITVRLEGPAVPRTGPLFGIFDNGRAVPGELRIHLKEIRFGLAPDFVERISAVSGTEVIRADQAKLIASEQLPEVFLDYLKVSSATTVIPVMLRVEHSSWPLILALSALAILVGGGLFFALWAARPRRYLVAVGSGRQPVSIRPFEKRVVSDAYGTRATVTGALFGTPGVQTVGDEAKDRA